MRPCGASARALLLGLLARTGAQCPIRCRQPGECRPPACGPKCCRYWSSHKPLPAIECSVRGAGTAGAGGADPPLVVLRNNSAYRASDIVVHGGRRWRRDSIRVLTQRRYHGSALHELLMATSTAVRTEGGAERPLTSMSADELAAIMRHARQLDRRLVGLRARAGTARGIHLAPELSQRLAAFARVLRRRLEERRCAPAPASAVAVHLRLGDQLDAPAAHRNRYDPHHISAAGRGFRALAEPIARHACAAAGAPPIGLVAVLNYSPHRQTHSFAWSNASAMRSLRVARNLAAALERCGVRYRWISRADADADLCHLLSAEHFVPSYGGLSALVHNLRQADSQRPGALARAALPAWSECTRAARQCLSCAIEAAPA